MIKTLKCEATKRTSNFEMPIWKKVTAEKVDEIEAGVSNLYKDADGRFYYAQKTKCFGLIFVDVTESYLNK